MRAPKICELGIQMMPHPFFADPHRKVRGTGLLALLNAGPQTFNYADL
jgi:hypothetical protein